MKPNNNNDKIDQQLLQDLPPSMKGTTTSLSTTTTVATSDSTKTPDGGSTLMTAVEVTVTNKNKEKQSCNDGGGGGGMSQVIRSPQSPLSSSGNKEYGKMDLIGNNSHSSSGSSGNTKKNRWSKRRKKKKKHNCNSNSNSDDEGMNDCIVDRRKTNEFSSLQDTTEKKIMMEDDDMPQVPASSVSTTDQKIAPPVSGTKNYVMDDMSPSNNKPSSSPTSKKEGKKKRSRSISVPSSPTSPNMERGGTMMMTIDNLSKDEQELLHNSNSSSLMNVDDLDLLLLNNGKQQQQQQHPSRAVPESSLGMDAETAAGGINHRMKSDNNGREYEIDDNNNNGEEFSCSSSTSSSISRKKHHGKTIGSSIRGRILRKNAATLASAAGSFTSRHSSLNNNGKKKSDAEDTSSKGRRRRRKDTTSANDNFINNNNSNSIDHTSPSLFINNNNNDNLDNINDNEDDDDDDIYPPIPTPPYYKSILKQTCLNPRHSLQNQLFLSFGTVSALAILSVVLTAIATTRQASHRVQDSSRIILSDMTRSSLGISSRYVAESLNALLLDNGMASLMMEVVRDRFVGYPDEGGYEGDEYVPFQDYVTGKSGYPLRSKEGRLPLDFEVEMNVDELNYFEHVQNRWDWYHANEEGDGNNEKDDVSSIRNKEMSTASSSYSMQGHCDPSVINPTSPYYLDNCTMRNNDMSTGGILQPTDTHASIAEKSSDLNFLLKPLYEYHLSIVKTLGIQFANSGAGSGLWFPPRIMNGNSYYTSIGCEWMLEPNPLDPSKSIGTEEMVQRCHREGRRVNGREYNALERAWCRDQALDPGKVHMFGPYKSALSGGDGVDDNEGEWLLTFGRSVYDRMTNEFIACILIDVDVNEIVNILRNVKIGVSSKISLVRWDDGVIVASSEDGVSSSSSEDGVSSSSTIATSILDREYQGVNDDGIDRQTFQTMKSIFPSPSQNDQDSTAPPPRWDPQTLRQSYETTMIQTPTSLISAHPLPIIPDTYDPSYKPDYIIFFSMDRKEAFKAVDESDERIRSDVDRMIRFTLIVGLGGMTLVLLVLFGVSRRLTRPLVWINRVGTQVVDEFGRLVGNEDGGGRRRNNGSKGGTGNGGGDGGSVMGKTVSSLLWNRGGNKNGGCVDNRTTVTASTSQTVHTGPPMTITTNKRRFFSFRRTASNLFMEVNNASERVSASGGRRGSTNQYFEPNTELNALVHEFRKIVINFSGKGTAKVYKKGLLEVRNPFFMFNEFEELYLSRNEKDFRFCYGNHNRMSLSWLAESWKTPPLPSSPAYGPAVSSAVASSRSSFAHSSAGGISSPMNTPDEDSGSSTNNKGIHSTNSSKAQSPTSLPHSSSSSDSVDIIPTLTQKLPTSYIIPQRNNFGRNIRGSNSNNNNTGDTSSVRSSVISDVNSSQILSSPLFWWIVGSIMTPLLITMIAISVVVTWNMSSEIPSLIGGVEQAYLDLSSESLGLAVTLRANYTTQVMERPLRDLHVFTRVANWLLLGQIERNRDVYTEMFTGIEDCKTFPADQTCGYYNETELAPCDCEWKDALGLKCQSFSTSKTDSRYLQKMYFVGQSQDTWPNGDRNSTSYPALAYSAATTAWWSNQSSVPGSSASSSAEGYDTTYDRLRVISASSVIQMPIYNHRVSGGLERHLGLYVGFEADGMFLGYGGCDHSHLEYSHWHSSVGNGAAKINPTICPLGKYGYDCRCRGWYGNGKENFEDKDIAPLYVTAPYVWAGSGLVGMGASLPLADSVSGVHIGETLVDIFPTEVMEGLQEKTTLSAGGFPILMTTQVDDVGSSIIVGPGCSMCGPGSSIGELVLPHDCAACSKRRFFETDIIAEMRAGKSGRLDFVRSIKRQANHTSSGDTSKTTTTFNSEEERVQIAYAPVRALSFRPTNSSDFKRGVEPFYSNIFSLALVQPYTGLLKPFQAIGGTARKQANVAIIILVICIVMAALMVVMISWFVTVLITVPIAQLLALVKDMKRCDIKEDMPQIHGGSRELSRVYDTFEQLYTVVRFSNSAYFSGDLEKAYEVLLDALTLFQQMNNDKAIGVANNNLGNMMLTMYRTMQSAKDHFICGMTKTEIIKRGIAYFDSAIDAGEEAIERSNEQTGFSFDYLMFMQQLSNRYFNRAMFLLTVRKDHENPENAESLGLSDLVIARDMDVEVVDQADLEGFSLDEEERFNLLLGRIRGLLILMGMSYTFDWDIEELIEDALKALRNAMRIPGHGLFRELSQAGQMQQLDRVLIEYVENYKSNKSEAGRIAIRTLVEDEYVLLDVAIKALEVLIKLDHQDGEFPLLDTAARKQLQEYKVYFQDAENDFLTKEIIVQRRSATKFRSSFRKYDKSHHNRGSKKRKAFSLTTAASMRFDTTMEEF